MKVYHGSNGDIDTIDVTRGSQFRDFGKGFYVTPDFETAKRMADKKTRLLGGQKTIIEYEFDESVLDNSELQVIVFPERATADWIRFIARNRDRHNPVSSTGFDIVKGPIADDGVALQLSRLKVHADHAEAIAADLQDKYLDQQICFCSFRSLILLKKSTTWKI